jgi:hypothetical protein
MLKFAIKVRLADYAYSQLLKNFLRLLFRLEMQQLKNFLRLILRLDMQSSFLQLP